MTQNELLLLIAFLTGITAVIQCIEMYMLISSSRRTNELLEDPSPLIVGIVEKMAKDKGFAKSVGSLFVFAGQCAFSEMRDIVAGKIPNIKPPRNISEAIGQLAQSLFAMPDLQQALANKTKKAIGAEAVEAAETVIEGGKWL